MIKKNNRLLRKLAESNEVGLKNGAQNQIVHAVHEDTSTSFQPKFAELVECRKKSNKRPLSGILLLNKSQGVTSNQALQKIKGLFNAIKAGHTGSLDPLATGMLPICFGEANKFSQYLLDADKLYIATAKLGVSTDTGDADGNVIATNQVVHLDAGSLEQSCKSMIGNSEQIPPMYSALKYKGQPLYKLARKGLCVERQARKITIKEIQIKIVTADSFSFFVRCSKGTYIRTLIEEIASKMGYYAHMSALHRVATAGFEAKQMYRFNELEKLTAEQRDAHLLPPDAAVLDFPSIYVDMEGVRCLQKGQQIGHPVAKPHSIYRLYNNVNEFYGLVKGVLVGRLAALRLLSFSMHG